MAGPEASLSLEWVEADDHQMDAVNGLRHRVLFEPFGISRDDYWGDESQDALRLVARLFGEIVGFGSLVLEGRGGRVRQVCVAPEWQGAGIGRAIMDEIEAKAVSLGLERLWLEARVTAEGFYSGLGYTTISGTHPSGRTGMPHVTMEKPIA